MNQWDGIDPIRTRLRVLVAQVENALGKLRTEETDSKRDLEQAWVSLVEALALGHEPEVRSCPFCQRAILHRAVRCRYCMKSSTVPVAPARASS